MADERREQEESEALLQSEALRAANETSDEAVNNNSASTSNGNFSIRINVGRTNPSDSQQGPTIRFRRNTPSAQQQSRNAPAAPVHARTIDRFPGGQTIETTTPQPISLGTSTQRTPVNGTRLQPSVTGAQSTGARRGRIPLRGPNGAARAIRVTPGIGRNTQVRIVAAENGNQTAGQVQQRVQVPPLVPQPLPYHASSYNSNNDETSSEQHRHDRNDFKCLICFEFLQDPASCGSCQSRFCLTCIRRVAQMGGPNTVAKCPTCRCEFSSHDIQRDSELRERMQRANTVECQYQGCSAQLPLNQVASHEQSCLFVPLKCRYATFGCDWKGTRQSLVDHESTCPLMQVSNLVEQFRQTRAEHHHVLNHLQTRVAASNAMMELHASLIRRLQKRSYHPGDMLDLVYTVTCTPARYIHTKDVWRALTACRLARGFLCNVLVFLPITLAVLRIDLAGSRQFLELDSASILEQEDIGPLVDVLLAFVTVLIWITLLVVFIRIGKNSVEWEPNGRLESHLVKGAAVLSFALQFGAMEYDARFVSWIAVCICTTFFPSLVLTMIETVDGNNRARPADLLTAGRAVPVILFGLRYGMLAHVTGIVACIDAVMFQSILRTYPYVSEQMTPLFVKTDCFCADISKSYGLAYVALRLVIAGIMCFTGAVDLPAYHYLISLGSLVLLLTVNYMVNNLILLGATVAEYIHDQAKENVLPNQTGVRKVTNLTGCLSFAIWIVLLGGIILDSSFI